MDSKNALENVGFNTNNIKNNDYEVNELLENIKFSPFEYKSIVILPKFDIFGLGYQRLKTFDDSVKPSKKYSKLTFEGKSIHGQVMIIYINTSYNYLLFKCILSKIIFSFL